MGEASVSPPFGAFRLRPAMEALRRFASRLPAGRLNRLIASGIRRAALAGQADPFDVEIFPRVSARLYPRSNRCEKAALTGAQFWDKPELEAIVGRLSRSPADRPFVFVDVGANVGLYSLYVCGAARSLHRLVSVVAIEPDGENLGRLAENVRINGFESVRTAQVAVGGAPGHGNLVGGAVNRGERRLELGANGVVRVQTLYAVLRDIGVGRVDCVKVDVEGLDHAVLERFFEEASPAVWPDLLIVEAGKSAKPPVVELCREHGYRVEVRTRLNAILARGQ